MFSRPYLGLVRGNEVSSHVNHVVDEHTTFENMRRSILNGSFQKETDCSSRYSLFPDFVESLAISVVISILTIIAHANKIIWRM